MTKSHQKERYTSRPDKYDDTSARIARRLGGIVGLVAGAGGACVLAIGAVTAARSHHVLSELPQWANPIEHMNNVDETLAVDIASFLGVSGTLFASDRCLTPRGSRAVSRSLMIAGVVLNGIAELPQTQPLVNETHLFTSSTPDGVDFIYGAAASVLFASSFEKVLSSRFGSDTPTGEGFGESSSDQEVRIGPADLDLVFEGHTSIRVNL